jgi:hypothetical protein
MKTLPLVLLVGLADPAGAADAVQDKMAAHVRDTLAAWRLDPVVQDAIKAVNASAVPDFLQEKMKASNGAIVEMIRMDDLMMDDRGLNVGVTDVTSDDWQGDGNGFLKTCPAGATAMDAGDIELEESSQTCEAQVSFTGEDAATGAPIGALTVGLNADAV